MKDIFTIWNADLLVASSMLKEKGIVDLKKMNEQSKLLFDKYSIFIKEKIEKVIYICF